MKRLLATVAAVTVISTVTAYADPFQEIPGQVAASPFQQMPGKRYTCDGGEISDYPNGVLHYNKPASVRISPADTSIEVQIDGNTHQYKIGGYTIIGNNWSSLWFGDNYEITHMMSEDIITMLVRGPGLTAKKGAILWACKP
jgi:hypothetical protein